MTIAIHATLSGFLRDFGWLLDRPLGAGLLAVAPGLADLPCGGSATAVFLDGQRRTIRRDKAGFVTMDGPAT